MVRYGQMHGDNDLCHHTILTTLGEVNDLAREKRLKAKCTTNEEREIGRYAQTVVRIVDTHERNNERCTLNQVVTKWRSKSVTGDFSFLKDSAPKGFSKDGEHHVIRSLVPLSISTFHSRMRTNRRVVPAERFVEARCSVWSICHKRLHRSWKEGSSMHELARPPGSGALPSKVFQEEWR